MRGKLFTWEEVAAAEGGEARRRRRKRGTEELINKEEGRMRLLQAMYYGTRALREVGHQLASREKSPSLNSPMRRAKATGYRD